MLSIYSLIKLIKKAILYNRRLIIIKQANLNKSWDI